MKSRGCGSLGRMSRKALLNRCRYSWRIRVDRARRRFWPRLPFEKTKASPPLTESQFEIIVGIVTTLIFLLFPLTWQLKAVCVMVLCALVALLAFSSHFMLGYRVRVKLPLALVIISGILWKAWKPIKDQYLGTPIVADRPVGLLVWGFLLANRLQECLLLLESG